MSTKNKAKSPIGLRFKEARESLKMTQQDYSVAIGIPLPTLRDYEAGKTTPGGDAIARLVRYGINAYWLLTGEGSMQPGQIQPVVTDAIPSIDRQCLELAIKTIEEILRDTKQVIPDLKKKTDLIMLVYDLFRESQDDEAKERVLKIVRLAA